MSKSLLIPSSLISYVLGEVIDYGQTTKVEPNELIQPNAVIASHANEAATLNGVVQPDTRTVAFIEATQTDVYVPLSGRTLSFNSDGVCTDGCAGE